jgi:hypothetical protein
VRSDTVLCEQAWRDRFGEHRGGERVDWILTFAAAAYNLVRLRTLLARPA